MKIFTVSLLTCLVIFSSQIGEIRTETSFDLMMDMMTSTAPCLAPCVFDNFDGFISDFNRTCVRPLIQKFSSVFPTPPPRTNQWNAPDPSVIIANITKQICTSVDATIACAADVTRKYCGKSLGDRLASQLDKIQELSGCDVTGSAAGILKCQGNREFNEIGQQCVKEMMDDQNLAPIIQMFSKEYSEIYEEVLAPPPNSPQEPPKICMLGNAFTKCMTGKLKDLKLPECSDAIVDKLEEEMNSVLDLINCRTYNRKNDGLTCLANPKLFEEKMSPCISRMDLTNLEQTFIMSQSQLVFKPTKMCDLVPLMDNCIEKELINEPTCWDDGWVLRNYRALATPTRDYFINKHCQGLRHKHKPSNKKGAGTCKNTFSDYKYGGADPNGASTMHGSSIQVLTTVLTGGFMWILHK